MRSYDTILREAGLIAIQLTNDDELVGVQLTDGDEDLLVVSARGQAARFHEGKVRPMGRDTRGVRAMTLEPEDRVLALAVARDDEDMLVVTGNGYGKRTPVSDYPRQGAADQGRPHDQGHRPQGRAGHRPAGARGPGAAADLPARARSSASRAESVRRTGRSTEGVRVMNMADEDAVWGSRPWWRRTATTATSPASETPIARRRPTRTTTGSRADGRRPAARAGAPPAP